MSAAASTPPLEATLLRPASGMAVLVALVLTGCAPADPDEGDGGTTTSPDSTSTWRSPIAWRRKIPVRPL